MGSGRVTGAAFRKVVDETVAALPAPLRARIKDVVIVVRNEPSAAELRAAGVTAHEGLYGLFVGRPQTERSVFEGPADPDRIVLYRLPLEEDYPVPEDLKREIRVTLIHELGHFFGLSEDDEERLGYA